MFIIKLLIFSHGQIQFLSMTLLKLVASSLGEKVADFSEQCSWRVSLVVGAYWNPCYNSWIMTVFHYFSRFTLCLLVNSRIVRNPFQTGWPCLRATIRYVPKLNFKTYCFLYWGKNHLTVSILLFCLHFSLLLCSFNLSSVINFVAISAFLCGCFKAMFAYIILKPVWHSKGDMHMLVMNCNDKYGNHHFHLN